MPIANHALPCSLDVFQKDFTLQRQPLRGLLSGKNDQFVRLIVEQHRHSASVLIHIKAFQLDNYPEQWYYAAVALLLG